MKPLRAFLTLCVIMRGSLTSVSTAQAVEISVPCEANALITAINTANGNGAGKDTLHLAADCVYTLAKTNEIENPTNPSGLPIIRSTIEIEGNRAIIERSQVANTPPFRILFVDTSGVLILQNLTLRNGRTVDGLPQRFPSRRDGRPGGAIFNRGSVTLIGCTVSGNSTGNGADYERYEGGEGGEGGGIYNQNKLIMINSTVSGNSTGHGGFGLEGGEGGFGGGLSNSDAGVGGVAMLINTTISGNTTGNGGEGSAAGLGGPGGDGGGINNHGQLTVLNSTISDNTVGKGGASPNGSGTEGKGGGIRTRNSVKLRNSLVALQRRGKDCEGADPETYIYSLDSDNSCNPLSPPGAPLPLPPQLGPLQNNGGPTQTHPLLCGSPAIDAGDRAGCTDADGNLLTTDQRGVSRPQGAVCDVGAFEVQAGANLVLAQTVSPGLVGVGQPLTYSFTVTNQGPDAASGVTLTSSLPLGEAIVTSVHASQGMCSTTGVLSCALDELACGEQATVEVILVASGSGALENTALVQSAFPTDPVIDNNTHTEVVRVGSLVSLPLPFNARVAVEFLTAPASVSQAVLTGAPLATKDNLMSSGCNQDLEDSKAKKVEGVLLNAEKSRPGCRILFDAVPNTTGRMDAFPAGTVLTFSDVAGWENAEVKPLHADLFPNQIFRITWRPQNGAPDEALVIVVRLIRENDPSPSCPSRNSLDADGDGLWDDWERFGVDTNGDDIVDLDLPRLGADPNTPDVFMEIDYMDCDVPSGDCSSDNSHHTHKPKARALQKIKEAFRANDGACGSIRLHINEEEDQIQTIPHRNFLPFGNDGGENFFTLKTAYFGSHNPRSFAYHYGIFMHQQRRGATFSGKAEQLGNDFVVSLGRWNITSAELDGDDEPDKDVGTVLQQASSLMHELGHNFGLDHGGGNATNRKPNYPSVMNYTFQPTGVISSASPEPVAGKLTYSSGLNAPLDEENLQEGGALCADCEPFNTRYVCPYNAVCPVPLEDIEDAVAAVQTGSSAGPIDWNCNDVFPEVGVTADLNGNCESTDFLEDFDDWRHLRMDFQATAAFADTGGSSAGSLEGELDTVALNTWLTSAKDSFMREGAENTNEGENPILLVQPGSQAVIAFDLSHIPSPGVTSAKLRLTLAQAPRNTSSVTIQIYRLHRSFSFTEGNGSNWGNSAPQTRNQGNGEGVTWECASDAEIGNQRADCDTSWDGGNAAIRSLTKEVSHPRSAKIGYIKELDVTADVRDAIDDGATEIIWLLKKKDSRPGQISYFAKEGVRIGGEVGQAPSLFLKFD